MQYRACLNAASNAHAPWYVIPAGDRESARLIISEIILDTLKQLRMSYPEGNKARCKELQAIRNLLIKQAEAKR